MKHVLRVLAARITLGLQHRLTNMDRKQRTLLGAAVLLLLSAGGITYWTNRPPPPPDSPKTLAPPQNDVSGSSPRKETLSKSTGDRGVTPDPQDPRVGRWINPESGKRN